MKDTTSMNQNRALLAVTLVMATLTFVTGTSVGTRSLEAVNKKTNGRIRGSAVVRKDQPSEEQNRRIGESQ
jgi:hypothetical protein